MKQCVKCNKLVNANRTIVNIGIADIWNDHCEECGSFIDSGFENTKSITFDLRKGLDKCKVVFTEDYDENDDGEDEEDDEDEI
jgi:hypothetical protein